MNTILKLSALITLVTVSFIVQADDAAIKKALTKVLPNSLVDSIKPSIVKGVSEVRVGTSMFYVSDDGQYLFQGHLVELDI